MSTYTVTDMDTRPSRTRQVTAASHRQAANGVFSASPRCRRVKVYRVTSSKDGTTTAVGNKQVFRR